MHMHGGRPAGRILVRLRRLCAVPELQSRWKSGSDRENNSYRQTNKLVAELVSPVTSSARATVFMEPSRTERPQLSYVRRGPRSDEREAASKLRALASLCYGRKSAQPTDGEETSYGVYNARGE